MSIEPHFALVAAYVDCPGQVGKFRERTLCMKKDLSMAISVRKKKVILSRNLICIKTCGCFMLLQVELKNYVGRCPSFTPAPFISLV